MKDIIVGKKYYIEIMPIQVTGVGTVRFEIEHPAGTMQELWTHVDKLIPIIPEKEEKVAQVKWEYTVRHVESHKNILDHLSTGWSHAFSAGDYVYLKRPIS